VADATCEAGLEQSLLRKDGNGVVPVEADSHWTGYTKALQTCLRQRLATMAIVVEANPTSNVLIGGYPGFGQLPYDPIIESGIRFSLNTDDPGLMSTSFPAEHERVFEARAALSARRLDAVHWMEDRAKDARDSTFLAAFSTVGNSGRERTRRLRTGIQKAAVDARVRQFTLTDPPAFGGLGATASVEREPDPRVHDCLATFVDLDLRLGHADLDLP
jgi:hypothetical protein